MDMDINSLTCDDLYTLLALLKDRVPKVIVTVDADGRNMLHSLDCPIGQSQARVIYTTDEPIPVTKCLCLESAANAPSAAS